jgi:DNA-binding CsgD family transcriptional regulator
MNPALASLIPRRETVARMLPKARPSKHLGRIAPLSAKDVHRIVSMRNKGMALQDIADATGRHLNTVWTHVSRAVARGECIGGRMMRRTK